MHSRRIACFILGLWLGGGVFLFVLSRDSRLGAGRVLDEANPTVMLRVKTLGREDARLLFNHAVAEQVRHATELWEIGQIFLGALFFFFLLFGTREGKLPLGLALLILAIVIAQRFLLTPEVSALGRITDFVPGAARSGYRVRLIVLQGAYWAFEFGKWGVQTLLCAVLVFSGRRPSGNAGQDFDLIDKANYRHIDR
jgi:hypothetical protein